MISILISSNLLLMILKKGIADIRNIPYERDACIRRSKNFNMSDKFQEYIALYDEILAK